MSNVYETHPESDRGNRIGWNRDKTHLLGARLAFVDQAMIPSEKSEEREQLGANLMAS